MPRAFVVLFVTIGILINSVSAKTREVLRIESVRQPAFTEVAEDFDEFWTHREQEKGKGFKPFNRIRAFTETRLLPNGSFNSSAIRSAWETKLDRFPQSNSAASWTPMGPFHPMPGEYVGGMGRISSIARDPHTPSTLYVGAATGGLWRSVDDGATWAPLTDDLPVLGVSDIVVHPTQPDTLYLVTGDTDGNRRRTVSYSVGLLRTYDAGESWQQMGLTALPEERTIFTRLVLYPGAPDTMIAASLDGLYRSEDGGDTWSVVAAGGEWYDLEVDPSDGSRWTAAAAGVGIYQSADGGRSWDQRTNGLPSTGFNRIAVAIAPSDPDTIYALYADDTAPFYTGMYGVYRTDDGGLTWQETIGPNSGGPNLLGWNEDGSDTGGQGWFALALDVDPNDAGTVFVGSVNVWRSQNAGEAGSWNIIGYWYFSMTEYIHADHHVFEFLGDKLYVGNDGGLYRFESDETWTDLSNMLVISQVYRVGVYQGSAEPDLLLAGIQDNGTKLLDGTEWTAEIGGDGFEPIIDPSNPDYMYGQVYYSQVYRSVDGGVNWYPANDNVFDAGFGYWISPLVLDPANPQVLYRGARGIHRSDDRAVTWENLTGILTDEYVHNIAIAPSNPQVLYANDWIGNLFVSVDGGDSWNTRSTPGLKVTSLAIDPADPAVLYASLGDFHDGEKVYRSEDSGETWTNVSGELPNAPANTIVVHPANPDHLYLGTDIGIFVSTNGVGTWETYDSGLPNVIINELEIHENSNTLISATWGRGVWQSPALDPGGSSTPESSSRPTQWSIERIYPNPFNASARVEINLPESATVTVDLLSIDGRLVRTLHTGASPAGLLPVSVNGSGLSSGIYLLRVRVPNHLDETRRIALIR
jgi:photosystem II stability/assembly factor-like uncharacterized protein